MKDGRSNLGTHVVNAAQTSANTLFTANHKFQNTSRHIAGGKPYLQVSPHGWVPWSGATRDIRHGLRYRNDRISEVVLLSDMAQCVGGASAADANKERFEFMTEREMIRSRSLAIRATHGMSERIGVPIWVNHARLPIKALEDIPALFHRTSIERLQYIIQDGIKPMGRIGVMCSVYAPWDIRANNMQRNGDDTITALIIMDTRRMFFNFGWRPHDCGVWLSEAGPCVPNALPLDDYCKHIVIMNMENVGTILSRRKQGGY